MAIGWLAVLRGVPWADVISNAPIVADGAKKLWNAVAKKSPSPELPAATAQPTLSSEAQAIAILQAQLAAVEAAASDLHNQMLASSELIKALADQNTQLIKRVEANRNRVLWLAGATVVLGAVAAANLILTLVR
ncbi:hypothetical protein ACFQAT_27445 [Undibacterium arcticum]|uniref:Uncharacterized protein n=1 Tax=Undibacterium arcticum TaxID=1762892 RepID=A0ABV7EY67_9BURK